MTTTPGNQGIDYTRNQALNYTSYNYETTGKGRPDTFGVSSGNFDGQGGSFGIIQFNWGQGTVQQIFKDMFNLHAADVAAAFTVTADYNTFYDVVFNRSTADQIAWGDSVTVYSGGQPQHALIEPWNTYFKNLGTFQSYQDRQIQGVGPYWDKADGWVSDFGLWTRRGYALMFDVSVQFGGILTATHTDIMNWIAAQPTAGLTPEIIELRRMRYIADRLSQDHAGGAFSGSAYDRKRAIANGFGSVYGSTVYTKDFDCILEPNGLVGMPAAKKVNWITLGHSL